MRIYFQHIPQGITEGHLWVSVDDTPAVRVICGSGDDSLTAQEAVDLARGLLEAAQRVWQLEEIAKARKKKAAND